MRYMKAEQALRRPAIVFISPSEQRRVVFASSLGTIFEWYDFYLYATLAPFFASLFFPPGNDTAALLSAFATYAAGFLIRPFGAIVFGRVGDRLGPDRCVLDQDGRCIPCRRSRFSPRILRLAWSVSCG